ncbi:acyl carrier protein [Aliirhizobium smilacinae]|uniref:Acyl carrier protein n=1 Tax=Aliirhizobium smilacinae TaxID=1395944 RepID=A0A5C4XG73_9HYPH|nr:acyl carrier protein [Rhizobium smilacinae]TNM61630.1 acyl carrier protein [Rhizobium smilacinae]
MQTKPDAGFRRPTNEDLNDRVKGIIATYLDLPRELVVEEASLSHDLCADSLEITELVMVFEEEFGCKIGDDAADRFLTVGDIVRHLQSLAGV